jgi:hypothetical protein
MLFVLEGVNPTTFNLVSSLLMEVVQLAAAFVLSEFFRYRLSVYLRKGNTVPVEGLGRLPGDLIGSFHVANQMKWARPALMIFFLFASDYASAIAFSGLDFDFVTKEGPDATVLSLHQRNNAFPYDAIGDPVNLRTISKLEVLIKSGSQLDSRSETSALVRQEIVVSSFLSAADAIARGESVFLSESELVKNDPAYLIFGETSVGWFNSTDSTVLFANNSYLTAIDQFIPLDCAEESLKIAEQRGEWGDFAVNATVPNCTFTAPRSSGIYQKVERPVSKKISYEKNKTDESTDKEN